MAISVVCLKCTQVCVQRHLDAAQANNGSVLQPCIALSYLCLSGRQGQPYFEELSLVTASLASMLSQPWHWLTAYADVQQKTGKAPAGSIGQGLAAAKAAGNSSDDAPDQADLD